MIFSASDEEMKDELAGTTAVVVLLKDSKMYCVSILILFWLEFLFSGRPLCMSLVPVCTRALKKR